MLHDVIEGSHKLYEVVAGHGGGYGEDAQHRAAPHVLCERCHLTVNTKQDLKSTMRKSVCCSNSTNSMFFGRSTIV